jgi:DNA polymerase-3 subunit delta'
MAFSPADILQRLRRAHANGRLPHAILLTGPPGSGRRQLAWDIVAMVNGSDPREADAHPDVHVLEPASKSRRILLDQFHEFVAPFFSTSFRAGAVKAGLIFDADRLQIGAANAFLKTLEEPPDHCLFILVTTNPGLLPVTIVSRCFHFAVKPQERERDEPADDRVAEALERVLRAAGGNGATEALRLARLLQHLLTAERERIEAEVSAGFKKEKNRLGDTADADWIKGEETRLKALVEARALATRQRLVGLVGERAADVLRARHGVGRLRFPARAEISRELAGHLDDTLLLRVLDGAGHLRVLLDRGVKEEIAIEAGCLSLAIPT